jgi:molecular chaperone IbpA
MTIMYHAMENPRFFIDPITSLREFEKMLVSNGTTNNYPPHNLIRVDDNQLRLEFAVAGFGKKDINVTVDNGKLIVQGAIEEKSRDEYLYRGIATRRFSRAFELPEYVEVKEAKMDEGILSILLVRHVPEEKKPKTIQVK